jgi:predicted membrane-bound spermidine synthase
LFGGFTGSAIEIILLLAFQIIYGNFYQITGLIISVFMAGLAIGEYYYSFIFKKGYFFSFFSDSDSYRRLLFTFANCNSYHEYFFDAKVFIYFIFFILTFIISALIGAQFSLAIKLNTNSLQKAASTIYSADLAGAALGCLIMTIFHFPFIGMKMSCFIIAFVNMGMAFYIFKK